MAEPLLFSNGYLAISTSTGRAVYTELLDVKSIQMNISMAELDNAVMGDGAEVFYPGLQQVEITARCRQSFAATSADKIAFDRMTTRTPFRVKIRSVDAAVSTTNPSYWFGKCYFFSGPGAAGDHGQLLESEYRLRLGSPSTVNRSTST